MPKVSVIMPVYNVEPYLRDCLDSVINQTLQDIEIICIDDGSKDKSLEILYEYAKYDNRIKIILQDNRGAGIARNCGIKVSKGKYIAFIDSDDYYTTLDSLKILVDASEKNSALICGGSIEFLRNGNITPGELDGISYFFRQETWINYSEFQQDYYYQRFIYNRDFLVKNKILFPYYRRYQDPPFFVKAMITAVKFYSIPQTVYTYRAGASNVKWTADKIYDRLDGMVDELELSRAEDLAILHSRIVPRVKNLFQMAMNEPTVQNTERMYDAFFRLRNTIDLELMKSEGIEIDLQYLDSFLKKKKSALTEIIQMQSMDEQEPYVSVIIPVYNVQDYLKKCLDSIVHQTLKNIEIICVNDGSTDKSFKILLEYEKKDKRIKIINKENGGLSSARNAGVRVARGKYLYFIDSDDYLDVDALETLYTIAEKKELDVIYFDGESFYETEELKQKFTGEDCCYRKKEYGNIYTGPELYVLMRKDGVFRPMVWLQMIRREYYKKVKLSFYEGILHEDILFSLQCVLQASRVSHIRKRYYHYRRRTGAITGSDGSAKKVYGRIVSLLHIVIFMQQNKYNEEVEYYVEKYLTWLINDIKKEYASLTKDERKKLDKLTYTDKFIVRTMLGIESDDTRENIKDKINIPIIISLTTYPARIEKVHIVIKNMLNQSIKPDKILLYLAEEQFPDRKIPQELNSLQNECFKIVYCDDLKPHKKYFYAMQEYPEAIVITVDDDVYYPLNLVEKLLKSYLKYPHAVSCLRGHTIKMYDEDTFAPYKKWKETKKIVGQPSFLVLPTGVGGVLYPPQSLDLAAFDEAAIKEICLYTDDLWLKWMQLKKNIPCVLVQEECYLHHIDDTQDHGLWHENDDGGRNNKNWQAIMEFCGDKTLDGKSIKEKLWEEYKNFFPASENYSLLKKTGNAKHKNYENELQAVYDSKSYKIGRIITFFPRKLRGGVQCFKEHGLKYTVKRVLEHCGILMEIGRIITFFPRKLRGGVQCFKEHGLKYTVKRTLEHCGILMGIGLKK